MPREQHGDGGGGGGNQLSSGEGFVEGNDAEALAEAVRQAVDAANQPEGTILKVDIYVQSVGDPDVGAYRAIATPI